MIKKAKTFDECALYGKQCNGGRSDRQVSLSEQDLATVPAALKTHYLKHCTYCDAVYTPGGLVRDPVVHGKLIISGAAREFIPWQATR